MTTSRYDVIVLGSTLGALVAGTYLARGGLRVVLLEEDVHGKRPPLLREPFLLSGLDPGGPIDAVMRELTIPLIERREIRSEPVALQVVLPEARIEVGTSRARLVWELEAYGLAEAAASRAWLDTVDTLGDELRAALAQPTQTRRALGATRRPERLPETRSSPGGLPPAPAGLEAFVRAQHVALSGLAEPVPSPTLALLLRGVRDGAFRMPHAGRTFLDLFRRRFLSLHGEIRPVGELRPVLGKQEIGVHLPKAELRARALVIGAPRAPLARQAELEGSAPAWLARALPPIAAPRVLLRAERRVVPVGMATRLVHGGEGQGPAALLPWWLERWADPEDAETEWLVLGGQGASRAGATPDLAGLAPFAEGHLIPIDPGPPPRWDLDLAELRFPGPRAPDVLQRRPPVLLVGPERAPEAGFEGELLSARETALRLADRLGARTPPRLG